VSPSSPRAADARASNAGDRYHLVYVAQRALAMLHPSSGLSVLGIENVAPADQPVRGDARTFLGVDVAEYTGGSDAQSAESITLVQVKYSPLRPDAAWTLPRLVRDERVGTRTKARSSVFRKLADMFDALAPAAGERPRTVVRLLTNQPLAPSLRTDLLATRKATEGVSSSALSGTLARLAGGPGRAAKQLKTASGLAWNRFAQLLAAWDLEAFGQAALLQSEAHLFEAFRGASPEGSLRLEGLISHLQSAATPGHRVDLTRTDVLAFLRLGEDELYPAPSAFSSVASLFPTSASGDVRAAIGPGRSIVVVHGPAGAGKTSALRLALRDQGANVIYDCFAGGRGLRAGQERFEYPVCFVQIINELEARFKTGLFATTQLSYRSLLTQLASAVGAAAEVARAEGKQLVLAFDAIDNATEQQRRTMGDTHPSFVPMLWKIDWPANCLIVVSFRSENEGEIVPEDAQIAQRVEIRGFNEAEMRHLVSSRHVQMSDADVAFLQERTRGNPRVAAKVLDELATRPQEDAYALIDATARSTAFAYYDQERQRRLSDLKTRLALAVLYELRQPPALGTVSRVVGEDGDSLRRRFASVRFGVRVTPDDIVEWEDQDFLEWVGERLSGERAEARERLVTFCKEHFADDPYARWNLSYHMLESGKHEDLLAWWQEPGRIEAQRAAAQPHEEQVLADLRAIVLACLSLDRDEDAVRWLFRAADLAGGRDAFAHELAEFPAVAVSTDLVGLLDDEIRGGSTRPSSGRAGARVRRSGQQVDIEGDLDLASALAERPDRRDDAARLFNRAVAAIREARARDPEPGVRLRWDAWDAVARYHTRTGGLPDALEWLEQFGKEPFAWTLAVAVASDWIISREDDPIARVGAAQLDSTVKAAALLGVLAAPPTEEPAGAGLRNLSPTAVRASARSVRRALAANSEFLAEAAETDLTMRSGRLAGAMLAACEQLLAAGYATEALRLSETWTPRTPWYPSESNLTPYLRWAAVREAAGGAAFVPSSFQPPSRREKKEGDNGSKVDDSERDRLRRFMHVLYTPLRARALAWSRRNPAAAVTAIRSALTSAPPEAWRDIGRWMGSPAINAARLLQGVVALPGRDEELVKAIIDAKRRALDGARDDADPAVTDVLSRDPRYVGLADTLLREELQRCRPPIVPGTEAVRRLLSFQDAARRVDPKLARALIEQAREIAGEIDSLVPDRATALEQVTSAACLRAAKQGPDASTLDRLCALVMYWRGIDEENVNPDWALRLLARRDPAAAMERAWLLDEANLMPITTGAIAAASGAMHGGVLSASALWPLMALGASGYGIHTFAREVIQRLAAESDPATPAALAEAARLTRRQMAEYSSAPIATGRSFVEWADTLGAAGSEEAARMRSFVRALEDSRVGREAHAAQRADHEWSPPVEVPSPLAQEASSLLDRSPRDALMRLEHAGAAEIETLRASELLPLVSRLRDALALGDRVRLGQVVERWVGSNHRRADDAIVALDELFPSALEDPSNASDYIRSPLRDSLTRMLHVETLAVATHARWSPRLTNAVFSGNWATRNERRNTLLRLVALQMPALGAGDLFRLAAHLAELLDDGALTQLAVAVIGETVGRLPVTYTAATLGRPADRVVSHLLALCLCHREVAVRWHAVYAVVHGLCDVDELLPSSDSEGARSPMAKALVETLIQEFEDESHSRWASTREWLAFAFEHVGRRTPWVLVPAASALVPHAVSDTFPHVKIRGHLAGALRAMHATDGSVLDSDALRALDATNRPVGSVPRPQPTTKRAPRKDDHLSGGDALQDWDTSHYWYRPMLEGFAGGVVELEERAFASAVRWFARLGVTDARAEEERNGVRDRYKWQQLRNDHGEEPAVELLSMHAARHALFLVAGELVRDVPVIEESYGEPWSHFLRYRARGADAELTGRWVDAAPPAPDNYGVFSSAPADWRDGRTDDDHVAELTAGVPPGWLVLAGSRDASTYERRFSTEVAAALVDRITAKALVRVLEDPHPRRYAYLPTWEAHYDCALTEAEVEAGRRGTELAYVKGESIGLDGRFRLIAGHLDFHQELPLHAHDPEWSGSSRRYNLLAPAIAVELGWQRAFGRPEWHDKAGAVVARYETWSWERSRTWARGHRLIVRADAFATLLTDERPWDLAWLVHLHRDVLRAGEREGEFDAGTKRAFLWSQVMESLKSAS